MAVCAGGGKVADGGQRAFCGFAYLRKILAGEKEGESQSRKEKTEETPSPERGGFDLYPGKGSAAKGYAAQTGYGAGSAQRSCKRGSYKRRNSEKGTSERRNS